MLSSSEGSAPWYNTTYVRDSMGNVLFQNVTSDPSGPTYVPGRYVYDYDLNGKLRDASETVDVGGTPVTKITTYAYDDVGQLLGYSVNGTWTNYTYDAVGNRLTETTGAGTVTYSYNANGELVSTTDGSSYSYDDNGNLLTATVQGYTRYLQYDYENHLFCAQYSGVSYNNYSGDGLMTMTAYSGGHGNVCTNLVYSHMPGLATIAMRVEPNSGEHIFLWYVPGTDEVLGVVIQSSLTDEYFTFLDGLGNTRHFVAVGYGTDVWSQSYSPFGEMAATPVYDYDVWTWLPSFQGRVYSIDAGMYDFRARHYDAETGRFGQRDPSSGFSAGAYSFVANDPLIGRDPTGMMSWDCMLGWVMLFLGVILDLVGFGSSYGLFTKFVERIISVNTVLYHVNNLISCVKRSDAWCIVSELIWIGLDYLKNIFIKNLPWWKVAYYVARVALAATILAVNLIYTVASFLLGARDLINRGCY